MELVQPEWLPINPISHGRGGGGGVEVAMIFFLNINNFVDIQPVVTKFRDFS